MIIAMALDGADNDRYQRVREELRVHDALCTSGFESIFLHTLVPKTKRGASGRTEPTAYDMVPMLPGYAAVTTHTTDDQWLASLYDVTYRAGRHRVRAVKAVIGAIDPAELAPLLAASGRVSKFALTFGFAVGDRVRVVSGLLEGGEGVVQRLPSKRVSVDIGGLNVSLPASALEKV